MKSGGQYRRFIDECLSVAHSGVTHDGLLESDVQKRCSKQSASYHVHSMTTLR